MYKALDVPTLAAQRSTFARNVLILRMRAKGEIVFRNTCRPSKPKWV